MDNYQHLYKGADGWEDWSTTFERNSAVRRSVVIRDSVDGSGLDQVWFKYVQTCCANQFSLTLGPSANGRVTGATAGTSFNKKFVDQFSVGFEECGQ